MKKIFLKIKEIFLGRRVQSEISFGDKIRIILYGEEKIVLVKNIEIMIVPSLSKNYEISVFLQLWDIERKCEHSGHFLDDLIFLEHVK